MFLIIFILMKSKVYIYKLHGGMNLLSISFLCNVTGRTTNYCVLEYILDD